MTLDDYNIARKKLDYVHNKAMADPNESNLADLIMTAALIGLVIMPISHLPKGVIPTPICGLISVPAYEGKGISYDMQYIFPADQHTQP